MVSVWTTRSKEFVAPITYINRHAGGFSLDKICRVLTKLQLPYITSYYIHTTDSAAMIVKVSVFVALLVNSAGGFSITMSSYLDNLNTGASHLSSFGSSSAPAPPAYAPAPSYAQPAAAPATPSYAPPTPAAAPYTSPFANLPASSSLDYLKTVGGGNQMKGGRNFSGVSSYFRPTYSTGNSAYLDDLKGRVMTSSSPAPAAPAPYQSSFASPPAPAPQAPAPYQSSFAQPPAPAPYQSSFASPPAPAPYQSSFAPASAPKSYAPGGGKTAASSGIGSYLEGI